MIREVWQLSGAQFAAGFELEGARPTWRGFLPRDDGTFAALATSLVLSGGQAEPPIGNLPVDRLGPPGSPLMARGAERIFVAPTRLGLALARDEAERGPRGFFPPGLSILVEPWSLWGLSESGSLLNRRLGSIFEDGTTPPQIEAKTTLQGSTLSATVSATFDRPAKSPAVIDPAWLDRIPRDRATVAFALAIDPGAQAWDRLFALIDRVERCDAARNGVAPTRLRAGLVARAAGIRIEADLLPHLKGISGWIGGVPGRGGIGQGLVALHLDDEAAATRIIAAARPPDVVRDVPGFSLTHEGTSVLVAWGEGASEASRAAQQAPQRAAFGEIKPHSCLFAAIWPGRVPGLVPEGTPLAEALLEAKPIACQGTWQSPNTLEVEARWPELDALVRRFLDRIPLDPPPDR